MSEQQSQRPTIAGETAVGFVSPAMYFPVSLLKLAVMSTCTFGFYELYWFYKNWCIVRDREDPHIMPFWRAFFAPIFCYSLLKRVQVTAEAQRIQRSIAAGPLAAGWFVFTILARLPDPYWLATFLAVALLLPVQAAVNEINLVASPKHDPNSRFTSWNIVGVVVGGLFLALVLVGTFLPPK
jgi:hypothetical protein